MKKEMERYWASCEKCGLAWTKEMEVKSVYSQIKCPDYGKLTENFDNENHNKGMYFKHC